MTSVVEWGDRELRLTEHVSVLVGADNGKYPSGNSLVVRGSGESVIIDPSVDVVSMGGAPVRVDAVINSHSHEDHMPGNGLFTDARVHIHHDDLPGAQSLDGLMDVYGYAQDVRDAFAKQIINRQHLWVVATFDTRFGGLKPCGARFHILERVYDVGRCSLCQVDGVGQAAGAQRGHESRCWLTAATFEMAANDFGVLRGMGEPSFDRE